MDASQDEGGGAGEGPRRRVLYGRRQGHALRAKPQGRMAELLPRVRLDLDALSDPLRPFPGCASLALEIGFGGGEHLAAQAKANPDRGFIGCEPFVNGVAKLLAAIEREGLTNIRVHPDDARDVLERLPAASLDAAYVLFPDPGPRRVTPSAASSAPRTSRCWRAR